jgi:ubiquinone/menaquinone biosynthesis C-methylase UbiE
MPTSSTTRFIPALRYEGLTALYDGVIALTMPERRFKTALVEQAEIRIGARVLDFGVGTATLSIIAKRLVPGSEVRGVDIDDRVIAIARQKIVAAGLDIAVDRYDGGALPYRDASFDRVLSSLVFHHLTRDQKLSALREIRRVLKPGGQLHVADWGKAANAGMRTLFLTVQLLDGFETTTDSVNGLLPGFMQDAGFVAVTETRTFSTVYGTLSLYRAQAPDDHS